MDQVSGRLFLLTDDRGGVAGAVASRLRSAGARVVVAGLDGAAGGGAPGGLADPTAVAELAASLGERHGPVSGLLHLLPLHPGPAMETLDLTGLRRRLWLETRTLFLLARALHRDLRAAGRDGHGWLVAAVAMDGSFGAGGDRRVPLQPTQGAVAGVVKTLALEWPEVICKVVDVGPVHSPQDAADALAAELALDDGEVEVGHAGGRRLVLRQRPAPLPARRPAGVTIHPGSRILVTGGARGITARVALDLAARYRPTLVLVGRSPLPEAEEEPDTAGLHGVRELKAALRDRLAAAGSPPSLAAIEASYTELLRGREVRRNLAAMRAAGATVDYHQTDVRDPAALGEVVDRTYRTWGRIDGVVHGAGLVEDGLVEDKELDSFDRVLETKVLSAFTLARRLRPESLAFLVFFSSVAARFGNRGQADYAAANEVLNKLAVALDRTWPGRVVAVNWGPWQEVGMAAGPLGDRFRRRGVLPIEPPAGCRALDQELRRGAKGQAEVIVGGGPWETPPPDSPRPHGQPLLQGAALSRGGGSVAAVTTLDPARDRYLQDHRLDGTPVLPLAVAMELMAETAAWGWPGRRLARIEAVRVLKGIRLGDGPRRVRVLATPRPPQPGDPAGTALDLQLLPDDQDRPGYRAVLCLGDPPPVADGRPAPEGTPRPFPLSPADSYRRWLFHGPSLQVISEIEGYGTWGIAGVLQPSTPESCLGRPVPGSWVLDPAVVDGSFQLAILWQRAVHDMTPLPSRLRRYRHAGVATDGPLSCRLTARTSAGGHTLVADIRLADRTGKVTGLLEGMEFSCSRELNRLGGALAALGGRA